MSSKPKLYFVLLSYMLGMGVENFLWTAGRILDVYFSDPHESVIIQLDALLSGLFFLCTFLIYALSSGMENLKKLNQSIALMLSITTVLTVLIQSHRFFGIPAPGNGVTRGAVGLIVSSILMHNSVISLALTLMFYYSNKKQMS